MDLYQIFITHNRLWSAREIIIFLVLLFLITGVLLIQLKRECETFSVNNVLEGLLW